MTIDELGAIVAKVMLAADRYVLSSRQHLPVLDGIRGLAIALVLWQHFVAEHLGWPESIVGRVLRASLSVGWLGVDLFFVLSGFLITGILYDERGASGYFRTFYARRTLRIFPLYYAFLAGYFLLVPHLILGSDSVRFVSNQSWFWGYGTNALIGFRGWTQAPFYTTPLWSLAVEEQFYLLWPLLVFLVAPERLARACMAVGIAAIVVRCLFVWIGFPAAAAVMMPSRMDALALGGMLAVVGRRQGLGQVDRYSGLAMIVAAAVLGAIWSFESGPQAGLVLSGPLMHGFGFSAVAVFFAGGLVQALTRTSGLWAWIGRQRGFQWLGGYAYGLYLLHNPVRLFLDRMGLDPEGLQRQGLSFPAAMGLYAAMGVSLSVGAAYLSWRFFEAPLNGLKCHFAYRSALSTHNCEIHSHPYGGGDWQRQIEN